MHTTSTAADLLGCTVRQVQRWCHNETKAGRPLGQLLGRDWLLSDADVRRLRRLVQSGPGRPKIAR